MIVPPGEPGVGHLHTKETPGTENEANLEGFEGNLEEGAILEGRTLRKPENRSFEEIGETASKLENPGNIGGGKKRGRTVSEVTTALIRRLRVWLH